MKTASWSDWIVAAFFVVVIVGVIFHTGQQSMCRYIPNAENRISACVPYER